MDDNDIEELMEVGQNIQTVAFSGKGGAWHHIWLQFKKLRGDLTGRNIKRKIIAIDTIFSLSHHNGNLAELLTGDYPHHPPTIADMSRINAALNAKFNAKTPADYWDMVSNRVRIQINQLRRGHGLPMFHFNSDRNPEIFTNNPHNSVHS